MYDQNKHENLKAHKYKTCKLDFLVYFFRTRTKMNVNFHTFADEDYLGPLGSKSLLSI